MALIGEVNNKYARFYGLAADRQEYGIVLQKISFFCLLFLKSFFT